MICTVLTGFSSTFHERFNRTSGAMQEYGYTVVYILKGDGGHNQQKVKYCVIISCTRQYSHTLAWRRTYGRTAHEK